MRLTYSLLGSRQPQNTFFYDIGMVTAATFTDINNDGWQDLVVTGEFMAVKIFMNNKGVFTNVTETIAKELLNRGIINQAVWSDMNGDGKKELMISGEWMGPVIFSFQNGAFAKTQNTVTLDLGTFPKKDTVINMDDFSGWWYSMKAEDIDNDGDMDIVLGNRGTNSSVKADFNQPCTVYAKDFDGNGSYDAVLGYYIHSKCYPLFSRDQLIDQMPMMRKKFIRYRDYSGTTLDALFTPEQKKNMDVYTTRVFESGVLINEGNGRYRFNPFPEMAQLSNINDIVVEDFDKDGKKDVLVCGNSNDAAVMVGNYDATPAMLLKGNGNGQFSAVSYLNSGLAIRGEVRKIIYVKEKNNPMVMFLKNSGAAQVFLIQ